MGSLKTHWTSRWGKWYSFLMIVLIVGVSFGCQDDDDDLFPPSIEVLQAMALENGSYIPGEEIFFNVVASPGASELVSFWIEREGTLMQTQEFLWNGGFIPDNPYILDAFQMGGFNFRIRTDLPQQVNTKVTYRVYVKDADDQTAYAEFVVTIGTATPVRLSSGRLYNRNSGTERGALDLDLGISRHPTDTTAEIQNRGSGADQWKSIQPFTYTELHASPLTFGPVQFIEEIRSSHDSNPSLDFATPSLGDVFTVRRDSLYYLLLVDEIFEDQDAGEDYIRFQIKR